jgi:hypothetical protein
LTTLVNINKIDDYDVYIGRAGKGQSGYFGNPPEHKKDGVGRDTIVERYRTYFYKRIAEDAEFRSRVAALKGLRLGCFCFPLKCHGMVIIEHLEGVTVEEQMDRLRARPTQPTRKHRPVENNFTDIFADQ